MDLDFLKMNGAGNDFVIFDARKQPVTLSLEKIKAIASRDNTATKGCDQVIVMESSKQANVFMRIYNADGGEVDACGNATRCVASLMENELGRTPVSIETNAGILTGYRKQLVSGDTERLLVDMGTPKFQWQDIPLSMPLPEASSAIEAYCGFKAPQFVSMGNPHVIFFVESLPEDDELRQKGAMLEHYAEIFPARVNVSFASRQVLPVSKLAIIHTKVWERGAGYTNACGTAACAIQAVTQKLYGDLNLNIFFENSGESLITHFQKDGHILLGGEIEKEFTGHVEL